MLQSALYLYKHMHCADDEGEKGQTRCVKIISVINTAWRAPEEVGIPLFTSHHSELGKQVLRSWAQNLLTLFILCLEVSSRMLCWCQNSQATPHRRCLSAASRVSRVLSFFFFLSVQILPDKRGSVCCLAVSLLGLTKVIAIIDVPLLIINVNESTKQ